VSRLLDALRNLQQPENSSEELPQRKVTPRLSASIRKAVLGEGAAAAPPAPEVLFRVPIAQAADNEPEPAFTAAEQGSPGPAITAPPPAPIVEAVPITVPDPVRLIEVIQASISSVQQEWVPQQASVVGAARAPTELPTPAHPSRPAATVAETELHGLLASAAHSQPYRDMLAMVQRDVAGKATPVIAIVGLEGQESTEHVTAALGTLLAEQAGPETLLIEANPKRPLAQRYGTLQAAGLTELLAGRTERSTAIFPTSHEKLALLSFGLATEEQARLLPRALSAAVRQIRTDHAVVIDAGPLSSPWAMAASQAADAVYLVVRVGDTSAEHATGCVERFRAAGGKLTGCIAVGPLPP
jgi:Mrp family chromosome partitioning ATPase